MMMTAGGTGSSLHLLALISLALNFPSIERAEREKTGSVHFSRLLYSLRSWWLTMKSGSQVYNQINLNKSRVVYLNWTMKWKQFQYEILSFLNNNKLCRSYIYMAVAGLFAGWLAWHGDLGETGFACVILSLDSMAVNVDFCGTQLSFFIRLLGVFNRIIHRFIVVGS